MPYIKSQDRGRAEFAPTNAGELNFALTELIRFYWNNNRKYQTANDIIGALENCKLEFYRRVIMDYEDSKIVENGDVYNE